MFRKNTRLLILVLCAFFIKVFSLFPYAVEQYYSNGLYPYIAGLQRVLLGWIPFSVGDLFYGAAGIWLIAQLVKVIKRIKSRETSIPYLKKVAVNSISGVLLVYVIFNSLWGLNYNRVGIRQQLQLKDNEYTNAELTTVTQLLAEKMNALQSASERSRPALAVKKQLFRQAVQSYANIKQAPFLQYSFPSVKPSLYSYLGNYLGFTGYYNPFSGEAQVNTAVPLFISPFTTCHEIGHQLGYAKESEANFAGYLSAAASEDSSFLYSVYFDMYLYASRYLYVSDSAALRKIREQFSPGVVNDRKELSRFFQSYSNPAGELIDRLYSNYLRANEQPSGKLSYNEVIAMLIAYYKKYGRI